MEKWQTYSTISVLTLVLAISLGFNVIPDSNYYCDSRQVKAYCFELSSGIGTRCYTLPQKTKYSICNEGWQKIPELTQTQEILKPCASVAIIAYTDIGKFYCDGIGQQARCKRFEDMFPVS